MKKYNLLNWDKFITETYYDALINCDVQTLNELLDYFESRKIKTKKIQNAIQTIKEELEFEKKNQCPF